MKIIKKIMSILGITILSIFLIYNVYNLFCLKVLKKDLSSVFGYSLLQVVSGSMTPTIDIDDFVIINTQNKEYKENDIVTYYDRYNSFVTHRIVKIEDDKIYTKGDANASLDEPIEKEDIKGVYCFRIRKIGKIFKAFQNPVVAILTFILGCLICNLYAYSKENNITMTKQEEQEFAKYLLAKEKNTSQKKHFSLKYLLNNLKAKKNKKGKKKEKGD